MTLDLNDLARYDDVIRLRSGTRLTLRFAGPDDADRLQNYFRGLSPRSRYNRLMGPAPELPRGLLDRFVQRGEADAHTLLAMKASDADDSVVAELRYAFDAETGSVEFGLSVDDRWQGQGIGRALTGNVTCRASALGGVRLFGDTLRDNRAMIALARSTGFSLVPTPGDWKQVRFEKVIGRHENLRVSRLRSKTLQCAN